MGLLEKAFFAYENNPAPHVIAGKGLLGIAEKIHLQKTETDYQNDTSTEITNLCIDRLSRLADDGSTVDTALSILKAYFPIIAALVFSDKDGEYVVSNSVGSHAMKEGISLQVQKYLISVQQTGNYGTFPASYFGLNYFPANSFAYAYPLHDLMDAPKSFLVLITENNKTISQEPIKKLILDCALKFTSKRQIKEPVTEVARGSDGIQTAVAVACDDLGGKAQVLIFELEKKAFQSVGGSIDSVLSLLIGKSARFVGIEPPRFMILLKDGIDRELYSHQLIRSIKSNLNLEPGQIKSIHSSDALLPQYIKELISTII